MVHVALAARSRQCRHLHVHHLQVVANPAGRRFGVQSLFEVLVLSGNPHRAQSGLAVVTAAGCRPQLSVVVLHIDPALRSVVVTPVVATQGDQRRLADRDRIGPQGQCLGDIRSGANATGNDQSHIFDHVHLFERFDRLRQCRQCGDAGVFDEDLLSRRGASLHAVDHHHVGTRLDRQLDVIHDPRGSHLDVDRLLPIGDLSQLLDLDRQVIGPGPVRMPAGRPLVDPLGQSSHARHTRTDLLPQQHPPTTRLGSLAQHDLDRVGRPQIVRIEAVTTRQALVDQGLGRLTLLGRHPAIARRCRCPHRTGRSTQGVLGRRRQRPETHAGNRDRDLQLDRPTGEPGTQHGPRRTLLAVSFEWIARRRSGQEDQVIERRQPPLRSHAADVVEPALSGSTDVGHHVAVERRAGLLRLGAASQTGRWTRQLPVIGGSIVHAT